MCYSVQKQIQAIFQTKIDRIALFMDAKPASKTSNSISNGSSSLDSSHTLFTQICSQIKAFMASSLCLCLHPDHNAQTLWKNSSSAVGLGALQGILPIIIRKRASNDKGAIFIQLFSM